MFAILLMAILGDVLRVACRLGRLLTTGASPRVAVATILPENQEAAAVFQTLLAEASKTQSLRQQILNNVMSVSPPHYPELQLMMNCLRSVQKANNSLQGLVLNVATPPTSETPEKTLPKDVPTTTQSEPENKPSTSKN